MSIPTPCWSICVLFFLILGNLPQTAWVYAQVDWDKHQEKMEQLQAERDAIRDRIKESRKQELLRLYGKPGYDVLEVPDPKEWRESPQFPGMATNIHTGETVPNEIAFMANLPGCEIVGSEHPGMVIIRSPLVPPKPVFWGGNQEFVLPRYILDPNDEKGIRVICDLYPLTRPQIDAINLANAKMRDYVKSLGIAVKRGQSGMVGICADSAKSENAYGTPFVQGQRYLILALGDNVNTPDVRISIFDTQKNCVFSQTGKEMVNQTWVSPFSGTGVIRVDSPGIRPSQKRFDGFASYIVTEYSR